MSTYLLLSKKGLSTPSGRAGTRIPRALQILFERAWSQAQDVCKDLCLTGVLGISSGPLELVIAADRYCLFAWGRFWAHPITTCASIRSCILAGSLL